MLTGDTTEILDLVFCDYVTQKPEVENCFLDLNGFLTLDAVSCPGHYFSIEKE